MARTDDADPKDPAGRPAKDWAGPDRRVNPDRRRDDRRVDERRHAGIGEIMDDRRGSGRRSNERREERAGRRRRKP